MNPELQKITERLARVESTSNNISEILARLEFRLNTHRHLGTDLTQELAAATVVYPGYVKNDATYVSPYFLPTGWSAATAATGKYVITHSLGLAAAGYTVVITSAAYIGIPIIQSLGTNSFEVWFYSIAGSLQVEDFTFILIPA